MGDYRNHPDNHPDDEPFSLDPTAISEQLDKTLNRAAKTLLSIGLTPEQLDVVLNVLQDSMAEAGREVLRLVRQVAEEYEKRDR